MSDSNDLWTRWVDAADLNALGRLFDATAPELRRLALFMAKDVAAADDALQATFLAALERPKALGDGGRVEAWLAGILARQVRRQYRDSARGSGGLLSEDALADVTVESPSPAGQAAGAEFEDRVRLLLDGMPEVYSVPLRRKLLDGQSAKTIAVELGVEPSTVHTRLSRGLAKLRKALPAGFAAPALAQLGASGTAANVPASTRAHVLEYAAGKAAANAVAAAGVTFPLGLTVGLLAVCSLALAGCLWWLVGSPAEKQRLKQVAGYQMDSPEQAPLTDSTRVLEPSTLAQTRTPLIARDAGGSPTSERRWSGTVVPRVPGVRVHRLEADTLRPLDLLATTEDEGRFAFTGPAELEHQIGFFLDGYTVWASPLSDGQRLRSDRDSSRRVDGQHIRFGDPRLLPGARVRGRVQDARGAPVAEATLYVAPRRMLAARQHDRSFGTTARDGSFELDSAIAYEDYGQVLFAVTPDGRTGWTLFACPEGKEAIHDLEVTVHDVCSGRVEVLDEDTGAPIESARVVLSPTTDPLFEHSQSGRATMFEQGVRHFFRGRDLDAAWSAFTGADGWAELTTIPAVPGQGLEIEGVKPYACWVTATAPGYEIAKSRVLRSLPEAHGAALDPGWAEFLSGTVSLRMKRALTAGHGDNPLIDESADSNDFAPHPLSIRVLDLSGVGLDGFQVQAAQGERRLGRGGLWNGGRWSWSNANDGAWTVEIYDPLVMRDFRRPPIHRLTLRGGAQEHLIHIQRPAPEPAGQVTLQLYAKETLEPLDPTSWLALRQQDDGGFRTEPVAYIRPLQGALRLENLPPGDWRIKVQARGHLESEVHFKLTDGEDQLLRVELRSSKP